MFKNRLNQLKGEILKSKGFILIALASLFLLVPSIFAAPIRPQPAQEKVLGATKQVPSPSPTPSPSASPSPKAIALVSLVPTPTPTVTPTPSPAQTSSTPTPTPTSTPTPTPSPSPSPSPSPVGLNVHIGIDYAGQKTNDSYTISIEPGQKAWDAVVAAIGINNIQYDQYDFGKFITGFNGISADPNSQYYEFRVNGVSSSVGVSDYVLNDGDQLDFVLTSF